MERKSDCSSLGEKGFITQRFGLLVMGTSGWFGAGLGSRGLREGREWITACSSTEGCVHESYGLTVTVDACLWVTKKKQKKTKENRFTTGVC